MTAVSTRGHHVGAPAPMVGRSNEVTLHWRLFLLTLFYTSTSPPIRTISPLNTATYCLYIHAAIPRAASRLPCHLTPHEQTPAYTRAVLLVSPDYTA